MNKTELQNQIQITEHKIKKSGTWAGWLIIFGIVFLLLFFPVGIFMIVWGACNLGVYLYNKNKLDNLKLLS